MKPFKLVPAVVSNCEIASLEGFGDRRIQGQANSTGNTSVANVGAVGHPTPKPKCQERLN